MAGKEGASRGDRRPEHTLAALLSVLCIKINETLPRPNQNLSAASASIHSKAAGSAEGYPGPKNVLVRS